MYRNYDELKEVQKALRTYINTSRRKTVSKRLAVKTVITEFINTMKIMLPDDLSEALDSLDDEEPGAMVTIGDRCAMLAYPYNINLRNLHIKMAHAPYFKCKTWQESALKFLRDEPCYDDLPIYLNEK